MCRKAWGFESPLPHMMSTLIMWGHSEGHWPLCAMTATLERLRDRIGQQTPPMRYVIDAGSIRYFADAIMDPDPRYRPDGTRGEGPPAPLLAPATFFGSATGLRDVPAGDARAMSALNLPLPQGWPTLATGDEFEFVHPVRAGMTLIAREQLVDAYEKLGRSGRLLFYTIEKSFTTSEGEPVLQRMLHCAAREPLPVPATTKPLVTMQEAVDHTTLPLLVIGPITVRYLAMFATATAEFVDIHYDADYARSVGLPGPIIQGLYKTALIARMLKDWAGDGAAIRNLNVRHTGMDLAGSTLNVGGSFAAGSPDENITCDVWVRNQDDVVTTCGSARMSHPNRGACQTGRRPTEYIEE